MATKKKTTRKKKTAALAKVTTPTGVSMARVNDVRAIEEVAARIGLVEAVKREVMTEGQDFGIIPGTGDKPTLLQPGADKLCLAFMLAPMFEVTETFDGEHLEVVVRCRMVHAPSGGAMGEGIGSCSTRESKYAYRKAERVCPECGCSAIIKGKDEYGGGWLCWKKKDGCGAKFHDDDETITSQVAGRVPNEDIPDAYNTVRKMAAKRAKVAAVLNATGGTGFFTQDLEDVPTDVTRPTPITAARAKTTGNGHADDPEARMRASELDDQIGDCETVEQWRELGDTIKNSGLPEESLRGLRAHYGNKGAKLRREASDVHDAAFDDDRDPEPDIHVDA